MTELRNAVVVITGANGGFGHQFIRQLLAEGSRLILTDLDVPALEATTNILCREAGQGSVLQCIGANLASAAGCDALYQAVQQVPDILINNAGMGMFGRFDETPEDRWETLMQVNLISAMRLVHRFSPDMIARRQGHIVNIASIAGWVGTAGLAAYSASKYGLRGFGEALREELAPHNVHVTSVYPFFSRTPILNAPRYGTLPAAELPETMITDPADVIRQVLAGVKKNQAHIFPDATARRLHWLKRLIPGMIPVLTRRR